MKDYFLKDGGKLKKIGIKKRVDLCAIMTNENNLKFNNENIN